MTAGKESGGNKTKNDTAWEIYIREKNLLLDGTSYQITATELNQITKREARLLAKFDEPKELPKPLKNSGYTLLPIRNGEYVLFPGDLFIPVTKTTKIFDYQPSLPFPLRTLGRGSGESQSIDEAFNTGLLSHFLGIRGDLYLTIRGREHTKEFDFSLAGTAFNVNSVQIEVDAGYEGLNEIILLEAKIGIPRHFNLRQVYYPYRHFKSLVPEKNVRNVFLYYDARSATFQFHEYAFENPLMPATIYERTSSAYKLISLAPSGVYDLLDAGFQTGRNEIIPQADDLNKILKLLDVIDVGFNHADDVADYFIFTPRQSSYYRQAAEYLGLVTFKNKLYELTPKGQMVLASPLNQKTELLAKVVINSWIFVELIRRAGKKNGLISFPDIEDIIRTLPKADGTPYTDTTIRRRRSTITSWLKWLSKDIGCFTKTKDGYQLA